MNRRNEIATLALISAGLFGRDDMYGKPKRHKGSQYTGKGNDSRPISAGKRKKKAFGEKKLSKKQRKHLTNKS